MIDRIKNNVFTLTGLLLGMIAGFLYWKYIGCSTGTCPLTSSWKIMLVYGGLVGGLLGNMIQDIIKKNKIKNAN